MANRSPARGAGAASSAASSSAQPSGSQGVHELPAVTGGALGGFGQSLAQEVDNATAKWMKMISSTFLGEVSGSSLLGNSLFARRPPALTADYSQGDDARAKARRGATRELKIALVGGSAVGKTSIVRRWLQRSYPSQYSPTIGVDVHSLAYKSKKHDEEVLLHIWDVSSAEVDTRASALHSLICEDLDGIFFVFNVHRVSSIAAIDKWRHCLAKYTSAKEIPFFLLSHKADLLQKRVMTSDDIASYARNAGYKGWMWTVGRSNFGENDKHPAVMEALERMVEFILRAKDIEEQARSVRDSASQGIFANRTSVLLEVVQTDDALHQFSASLLRIPTQAITTIPRDENLKAVESDQPDDDEQKENKAQAHKSPRHSGHHHGKPVDYGGNWILGNNKGVYLRATNDSFVADDETEDEVQVTDTDTETFTFPFANEKRLEGESEKEEDGDDEEKKEQEHKQGDNGDANASESDDDDNSGNENEYDEARLQREKAAHDRINDELAWRFFAGSIGRTRTEEILGGKEEGTFLLRRKDAQTLILSYVGASQIHHVLIEYSKQKYHIGSSKTSQAAFATLWKCLRSVRRYAFRGLIFTRNVDFRVVNKEELSLETGHESGVDVVQTMSVTPNIWRTRTRSSSNSSLGDKSSSSSSRHASPTTTARKPRLVSGLQANQEQVKVPPKTRIEELSNNFYEQLSQRLSHLAATTAEQQQQQSDENNPVMSSMNSAAADEVNALLKMVDEERKELKRAKAGVNDAETQWRQLVKNMESWNRIVMNLVNGVTGEAHREGFTSVPARHHPSSCIHQVRVRRPEASVRLMDGKRSPTPTGASPPYADGDTKKKAKTKKDTNRWLLKSDGSHDNEAMTTSTLRRSLAQRTKDRGGVNGSSGAINGGGSGSATADEELFSEDDQLLLEQGDAPSIKPPSKKIVKHRQHVNDDTPLDKLGIKREVGGSEIMGSPDSLFRSVGASDSVNAAGAPLRSSMVSASSTSTSTREKLTIFAVIVHLCKGNIGPGAMSLPNGFSQTGIYAAPVMFVIVALVSVYNMDLLLYCKRMVAPTTRMSFGDVGREILGPKGKLLIDVFLVGTQLGICCVYFTFVATNIHVVLPENFISRSIRIAPSIRLQSVIHERQLILAIFPILLLLSWVRTLKRITPFSSLANVAVVSGIAIVFYYSLDYYAHPTKPRVEPVHVDWTAFPEFYGTVPAHIFGTAVYSFEGIGLILPIQNEMSAPHLFPRVLALCMLLILVLFLVIGEVPTIAFGRITNGSMTAVLHDYCEGWGVTAANALLAFACLLSFPIQFYPAIEVLEKSLSRPGSLMRPAALPHTALNHHHHRHPLQSGGSGISVNAENGQTRVSIPSSSSTTGRLAVATRHPQQQSRRSRFLERMFSMSQYECNRTIFRSMICTSLMIIAICIPDVGLLISLFGAVGSSMLAIIIPPVLYIRLHKHSLSLGSRVFHYGIIAFGLVGMVAGTLQALTQVAESLFR